jgi:hypothetical protein
MPAERPDNARPHSQPLALTQLDALVRIYREALVELRSWRDPRTATLIIKLETLLLKATRDRRYLIEKRHTASLL